MGGRPWRRLWLPVGLVLVGVLALLANLGLISGDALLRLLDLWPLILVLVGAELIVKRALREPAASVVSVVLIVALFAVAAGYLARGPSSFGQTLTASSSQPAQGLEQASLHVDFGAAAIEIRSGPLGGDLYQARFEYPRGERTPSADQDRSNGVLRISEQPGPGLGFRFGQRRATVTLNDSIPWSISTGGGAVSETLRLSSLQLQSLAVSGGASHVNATLPAPKGTVSVAVSGGANDIRLQAPKGTAARVVVSGGASTLELAGKRQGSFDDINDQTPDYDSASDRYQISVDGGASSVRYDNR